MCEKNLLHVNKRRKDVIKLGLGFLWCPISTEWLQIEPRYFESRSPKSVICSVKDELRITMDHIQGKSRFLFCSGS